MLKGFKEFLSRGNIVELAVAVVIGTAFVALVDSFTENFIDPLIASFGGTNVNGFAWQLIGENSKTIVDFGAIITAGITFLITAAVVYFIVVVPMNKMEERRKAKTGEEDEPTDSELLTEIRDLLRERSAGR